MKVFNCKQNEKTFVCYYQLNYYFIMHTVRLTYIRNYILLPFASRICHLFIVTHISTSDSILIRDYSYENHHFFRRIYSALICQIFRSLFHFSQALVAKVSIRSFRLVLLKTLLLFKFLPWLNLCSKNKYKKIVNSFLDIRWFRGG